jgi:fructose-specific phosphotransferase system component IIB
MIITRILKSRYKGIIYFSIIWTLLAIFASSIAYNYSADNLHIRLNNELIKTTDYLQPQLQDFERINTFLDIIVEEINALDNDCEIELAVAKFNKKLKLNTINNILLVVEAVDSNILRQTTDDFFIISRKLSSPRLRLTLNLDALEIQKIMHRMVRNINIHFAIENSTSKMLNQSLLGLSYKIILSPDLSLVLFFDKNYISEELRNIGIKIFTVTLIIFAISILIYLLARMFLLKYLFQNILENIATMKVELDGNQGLNKRLQDELTLSKMFISSLNYEMEAFKIFKKSADAIQQYVQVLLKSEKKELATIITQKQKEKFLEEIHNYAACLSDKIILEKSNTIINFKELVELIIKNISLLLNEKSITVFNECKLNNTQVGIGYYALIQLILTILAYQSYSLPKNRKIVITQSITKNIISIIFRDNGFGLDLKTIKNYTMDKLSFNNYILTWQNLEKSLQIHGIEIEYLIEKTGGQFVLNIPVAKIHEITESFEPSINQENQLENRVGYVPSTKKH